MDPETPLTTGCLFSHREALLHRAFQHACSRCCLRQDGLCDLSCAGRLFGQTTGLTPIQAFDEPDPNPDQPPDPCDWLPPAALAAEGDLEEPQA